jgi:quinol monooxygenase YgiN
MYGTIARFQVKPGKAPALFDLSQRWATEGTPGLVGDYVYQMDDEPDIFYLAVMFESKEAYFANANSPAQDARYQEMLACLAKAPEWHDGEIVFAFDALPMGQGL